jgi:hypothetical protein
MEFALPNQTGVFNAATLIWEIIPFSFVVDWFANIGGLINALNPNPSYKTLGSWLVSTTTVTCYGTITVTLPDSSTNTGSFSIVRTIKERTPDVRESFLSFDANLSIPKLLDAVALLQRFR